jgi:predicted glutamine amidotransferase
MCGIAGMCLSEKDRLMCSINQSMLIQNLAKAIEVRGNHATGIAFTKPTTKNITVLKQDIAARKFVKQFAARIPTNAHVCLIHTRYATQGSPTVNANNHPIISGSVIGIHNGHISNDDQLFRDTGAARIAEVDSEAAFAVLNNATTQGIPIVQALETIRGGFALAWINQRDGGKKMLHLVRGNSSPLSIGWTEGGSLVFASTMELLNQAAKRSKVKLVKTRVVAEGTYLRVVDGAIVEEYSFRPYREYVHTSYRHGSGGGWLWDDEAAWWDKKYDEEQLELIQWHETVQKFADKNGLSYRDAEDILMDTEDELLIDPTYGNVSWDKAVVAKAIDVLVSNYGYGIHETDEMSDAEVMQEHDYMTGKLSVSL